MSSTKPEDDIEQSNKIILYTKATNLYANSKYISSTLTQRCILQHCGINRCLDYILKLIFFLLLKLTFLIFYSFYELVRGYFFL